MTVRSRVPPNMGGWIDAASGLGKIAPWLPHPNASICSTHTDSPESCRVRKCATTDSAHDLPVARNLLDRQFTVAVPKRAWVSEITAIATREGWWYLAVVIDLCTRQAVGFAQAKHPRAELVRDAFTMAYWRHKPPKGLLC